MRPASKGLLDVDDIVQGHNAEVPSDPGSVEPSQSALQDPPESLGLSTSQAFDFEQGEGQGVSTFDDDEDDLEIRLDRVEAPDPDEEASRLFMLCNSCPSIDFNFQI